MPNKITKANGHIVQADWNQTDPLKMDYIHNKPNILTEQDVVQIIEENVGTVPTIIVDGQPTDEFNVDDFENQIYDDLGDFLLKEESVGLRYNSNGGEIFNNYEENEADGICSHAEGQGTQANGDYSHAEGESTQASEEASHAEGQSTMALGLASHSEGISTYTIGEGSHSEGLYSHADSNYAHAEGNYCVAYDEASHAEGSYSETHANSAHAEGLFSMAMGQASHTEGRSTVAMGENAHAEGESSNLYDSAFEGVTDQQEFHALWREYLCAIAYGQSSHVEGGDCMAYGGYAHAEGNETASMGFATHTEGHGTIVFEDFSHAQGKFNKVTIDDQYAHIVGNGESDSNRSNAHTLDWSGNAWFSGDVYVHSESGIEKDDGSIKLATVTPIHSLTDTDVEITLNNNIQYQCDNPITSLTITGFNVEEKIANNYTILFTAADSISVAYPETVKWALATPVFDPNKIYWLSFTLLGSQYLGIWTCIE